MTSAGITTRGDDTTVLLLPNVDETPRPCALGSQESYRMWQKVQNRGKTESRKVRVTLTVVSTTARVSAVSRCLAGLPVHLRMADMPAMYPGMYRMSQVGARYAPRYPSGRYVEVPCPAPRGPAPDLRKEAKTRSERQPKRLGRGGRLWTTRDREERAGHTGSGKGRKCCFCSF